MSSVAARGPKFQKKTILGQCSHKSKKIFFSSHLVSDLIGSKRIKKFFYGN